MCTCVCVITQNVKQVVREFNTKHYFLVHSCHDGLDLIIVDSTSTRCYDGGLDLSITLEARDDVKRKLTTLL